MRRVSAVQFTSVVLKRVQLLFYTRQLVHIFFHFVYTCKSTFMYRVLKIMFKKVHEALFFERPTRTCMEPKSPLRKAR